MEKERKNIEEDASKYLISRVEKKKLFLRKEKYFATLMKKRTFQPKKIISSAKQISHEELLRCLSSSSLKEKEAIYLNPRIVIIDEHNQKKNLFQEEYIELVIQDFLNNYKYLNIDYLSAIFELFVQYSILTPKENNSFFTEKICDAMMYIYSQKTDLNESLLITLGNIFLSIPDLFKRAYIVIFINDLDNLYFFTYEILNALLWVIRIYMYNIKDSEREEIVPKIIESLGNIVTKLKKKEAFSSEMITNLFNIYLIISKNESNLLQSSIENFVSFFYELIKSKTFKLSQEQKEYGLQIMKDVYSDNELSLSEKDIETLYELVMSSKNCNIQVINFNLALIEFIKNITQNKQTKEVIQLALYQDFIPVLIKYYSNGSMKLFEEVLDVFIELFDIDDKEIIIRMINYKLVDLILSKFSSITNQNISLNEKLMVLIMKISEFSNQMNLENIIVKETAKAFHGVKSKIEQLSIDSNDKLSSLARVCLEELQKSNKGGFLFKL